ncbi:hypothetical protein KIW84_055327 [Lathyrus oleraceus]|uniref:CCHC-type domain-containing protein n=1 Tax=Pisum sativum TaxID=3888 RepID=A0A9D4WWM3_PEA|nr:hypothetical protein KIW84_055327 [Pisum sativum]
MAFMSNTEEDNSQEDDEDLVNEVAMLGRQFNKLLKKMDVRSRANVKNISSDISKSNNARRRARSDEKLKEGKEVQCYECDGYGHIRTECGTYLKKQKMSLAATWSDESEIEEAANLVTAMTGRWGSDEDSSDDEVTFEVLASTYRKLCHKSVELCKQVEGQKKEITQLENEKAEYLETISKLQTEAVVLNAKLDENPQAENQKIAQLESEMTKPAHHHQDHYQFRPKQHMLIIEKQWVPKTNVTSLIAHIPLRISAKEEWYFDNGCSRHMTGNQDLLTDLHHHTKSHVTFGDGAKGEIKGTGKLDCLGVPKLDKVLLVKGLTENLISISQLCDQGLNVNFTKTECLISDINSEVIMRGIKTKDNCYIWSSQLDYPLKYWLSTDALKSDEK